MDEVTFLDQPLGGLGLGEQFARQSAGMGFDTLKSVTRLAPDELVKRPGFSYHWLGELCDYLLRHQMLHLLQRAAERSYD